MTETEVSRQRPTVSHVRDKFRTDVQGLRALAVLLVLLYHAAVPGFGGGFIGVDIFFVISGFLITTHLMEAKLRTGRTGFVKFYARRVQRLLPAAVTVIVGTAVAAIIFVPRVLMPDELLAGAAALLYVPNMYFAYRGSDYLAGTTESLFQQYWSLGVEEQFYLLWPLVIAGLMFVARRRLNAVAVWVGALIVVSFVLCIWVMNISQPWAFYSLPTRAWELGVGGLVAVVLLARPVWPRAIRHAAGLLGAALLIGGVLLIDADSGFPAPWAAIPVIGTALVILAGTGGRSNPVGRVLSWRPAQRLGDISYSVYLVHWPLLMIPYLTAGEDLPLWLRLLLAGGSIPLGWCLYRLVETPLRAHPRLRAAPKRVLGMAVIGAIVLAAGGVATRQALNELPYGSARVAPKLAAPEIAPAGTDFVSSTSRPSLMHALDDNARIYSSPCHQTETQTGFEVCVFGDERADRTIAMFGDSHTANWFPALEEIARTHHIRLESYSKSRCSSSLVEKTFQGRPYWECDEWRANVIDHLNEISPELVILANYSPDSAEATSFVDTSMDPANVWAAGTAEAMKKLTGAQHVTVLEDTPRQQQDPVACLARHIENANECATPVSKALRADVSAAEKAAVTAAGGSYVSLNDYFCNERSCPVAIGDMLVYRDTHHLTATYSRSMAPVVEKRVLPELLGDK